VKEQTIDLDLPGSLPKVSGIERLVREAVVNYLTNAVKFTPPRGRIVVRAVSAPPVVRIEVEDGGPGVPEDARESIFEEFARSTRDGGDEAGKSSGLGLSIVRRVAEALGGSCGVESAGERGSVFYLELPAVT
jgi:signal transduction histidine kinase